MHVLPGVVGATVRGVDGAVLLLVGLASAAPTAAEESDKAHAKHHADGKHHLIMCNEKHAKDCCGDGQCLVMTDMLAS